MRMRRFSGVGAVLLMAVGLTGCAGPPQGSLDSVRPGTAGTIVATGWTWDPDDPKAALTVSVFLDGVPAAVAVADLPRPDIAEIYPDAGPLHGFSITVPAAPGPHLVCTTFGDIGGDQPTYNCQLGLATNSDPFGALDAVADSGGYVRFTGWAVDPDTSDPIEIRVTENFDVVAAFPANVSRPDLAGSVAATLGTDHGYDVTVPFGAGTHRVCVYAANVLAGTDRQIGCADVARGPAPVESDLYIIHGENSPGGRAIMTFNQVTGSATIMITSRTVGLGGVTRNSAATRVTPTAGKPYSYTTVYVVPAPYGRTWACLVVTADGGSPYVSDCEFVNV